MAILLVRNDNNYKTWQKVLKKNAPEIDVYTPETLKDKEVITFILSWNAPKGFYAQFPNLKAISSMGAGADHILNEQSVPNDIPIARIVDTILIEDMAHYTLMQCLNVLRYTHAYGQHEIENTWNRHTYKRPQEITVGILGFGNIGQEIGKLLRLNSFNVIGYSHSKKDVNEITSYTSNELDDFLAKSEILVCVLPLNQQTENFLNKDLFNKLPKGAHLINIGRGGHLKEEDLIPAIDSNRLSGATLDVFKTEPLPKEHPFWEHNKIMITPHVAGISSPYALVDQVVENYKRTEAGKALKNTVSRKQGY